MTSLLRPILYFDLYFLTNKKSRFDKRSKYRGRSREVEIERSKYRKGRTDYYPLYRIIFSIFGCTIYIVKYAMTKFDIGIIQASLLLSIMAVTEFIGRIPWGAFGDLKWVNRHYLLSTHCMIMGLTFGAIPIMPTYTSLAVLLGITGIFQVRRIVRAYFFIFSRQKCSFFFNFAARGEHQESFLRNRKRKC